MAKPILYQPPPKKLVWTALLCSLAIYGGAVVAAIKREAPPVDLTDIPQAEVVATLETQPEDQPTPPPEDIPVPEPPPVPEIQPEFHEESTPPPKRPPSKVAPIKAPQVAMKTGTLSASGAKAAALFAPKPDYPYEARSRHVTGSGVCVVSIDPSSGAVTDASMAQSIGNPILDNATVSAFKRWRFKPGAGPKAKIPITFTMTGASY